MAVWSVVNLRRCYSTGLAAEHYHPKKLEFLRQMQAMPGESLGGLVDNIKDLFNPKKDDIPTGTRVYDLGDSLSNFLSDGRDPQQKGEGFESAKKIARPGDLIVSRLRSYLREVAIVPPDAFETLVSTEYFVLRPRSQSGLSNVHFLLPFVLSEPVQTILHWSQEGNEHPRFGEDALLNIRVPQSVLDSHLEIGALVEDGIKRIAHSREIYAEAETLLLETLGLSDLDASPAITYQSTFKEVAAAGRFDADYFQPRYQRVRERLHKLSNCQIVPLEEIVVELTNGQTPLRHDLSVGEVPFLTAEHVTDFRLDFASEKRILNEHHEGVLKRTQLRPQDVLITIKGRIGNAVVVENLPGAVNINQDVAVMRLKPHIPPHYLAGFLNCLAGKMLTEQVCTGQINPFLGLGNLKTVPIPIFDTGEMQRLGRLVEDKIAQAHAAESEAQILLDLAKSRVEQLIEEGA